MLCEKLLCVFFRAAQEALDCKDRGALLFYLSYFKWLTLIALQCIDSLEAVLELELFYILGEGLVEYIRNSFFD